MASILKPRRGTSTENDNFTGANGEITFDTTNKKWRYHDGATQGGFSVGVNASDLDEISSVAFTTANNNLRIATTGGSTYDVTILTSDKMSVANAQALYSTLVANTFSTANAIVLEAKVDDRIQVANATLLINDRMQVANVTSAISTAVSNLVDAAPTTLDTLNELAAALGDDANFSTTVTASIASKMSTANTRALVANETANTDSKLSSYLPLAGGTMTGQLNVSNHIVPTANVTYDLGSEGLAFRQLYLAGNTITLGGIQLSVDDDGDLNIVDPNTGNKVTIGVTNGIIVANTNVVSAEGNVSVPTGFALSTLTAFPDGDLNGDDEFVGASPDVLDAFGQDIGGTLFDCNEPKGRVDTSDLGAFA